MKLFYFFVVLFAVVLPTTLFAQEANYSGGSNDGFSSYYLGPLQVNLNWFRGGSGDGYSVYALSDSVVLNIYQGGQSDGYASSASLPELAQINVFQGGNEDGFAATSLLPAFSLNIYSGGQADGFASSASLPDLLQVNFYQGGASDGYSAAQWLPAFSLNIYSGGNADGFASSVTIPSPVQVNMYIGGIQDGYASASLGQASTFVLFKGGNADGYATAIYPLPELTTCPTPSNLQNFGNSPTSVTLGWTPGEGNSGYEIKLISLLDESEYLFSGEITESPMLETLTCLPAGTFFNYFIRESCGANVWSQWIDGFATYTTPGCAAPFDQNISYTNQENALLKWESAYGDDVSIKFQIAYGEGIESPYDDYITPALTIAPAMVSGNTRSWNLFIPGGVGNYSWFVREICGVCDTTVWTGPFNVPAWTCAVPPSGQMSVSDITQTTAQLNWTSLNKFGSAKIELENLSTNAIEVFQPGASNSYSRSFGLTGLTAGTTYRWRVRDMCLSGDTTLFTAYQQFTTAGASNFCPAPTGLDKWQSSGQIFLGKWSSPLYGNSSKAFQVSYGLDISSPEEGTVAQQAYFISQAGPQFPTYQFSTGNIPGFTWYVRDICDPGDTSAWAGPYVVAAARMDPFSEDVKTEISVYPNPNPSNTLFINYRGADGIIRAQIFDSKGSLIQTGVSIENGTNSIDISRLSNGMYFIHLPLESEVKHLRFIIAR